jgi:hypothetical protein
MQNHASSPQKKSHGPSCHFMASSSAENMPRIRPVLLLLSVLTTAWLPSFVCAADAALAVSATAPADAADLLFTARETHRAPLDFQTHLQPSAVQKAIEKADANDGVFMCYLIMYNLDPPDKWTRLAQLNREKFAALSFGDELQKIAYSEVFIATFDHGGKVPLWYTLAEADLLRRGDSATPLLLELFDVYPHEYFRSGLLSRIDTFPTINLAPYLQAARNHWLTLGAKTPPRTCHAIGSFLSRHGSAEDIKILQAMLDHPSAEVPLRARSNLRRLTERLSAAPKPGP